MNGFSAAVELAALESDTNQREKKNRDAYATLFSNTFYTDFTTQHIAGVISQSDKTFQQNTGSIITVSYHKCMCYSAVMI